MFVFFTAKPVEKESPTRGHLKYGTYIIIYAFSTFLKIMGDKSAIVFFCQEFFPEKNQSLSQHTAKLGPFSLVFNALKICITSLK